MAFFLSIPKKRASSDITLGKLIKQHIEKQGLYKVEDFQEAINELDKLREDIRVVAEKRESVVDLLARFVSAACGIPSSSLTIAFSLKQCSGTTV